MDQDKVLDDVRLSLRCKYPDTDLLIHSIDTGPTLLSIVFIVLGTSTLVFTYRKKIYEFYLSQCYTAALIRRVAFSFAEFDSSRFTLVSCSYNAFVGVHIKTHIYISQHAGTN